GTDYTEITDISNQELMEWAQSHGENGDAGILCIKRRFKSNWGHFQFATVEKANMFLQLLGTRPHNITSDKKIKISPPRNT
ncbi:20817_t:CDS:2, partial [Dentiscutata erythropus]